MGESKPYIGGQAVLEGVMLRAPGCLSIAVRRPDGTLALREGPLDRGWAQKPIWKWPGLRGVAMLVESMSIGARALQFSAEQQLSEEERAKMKGEGGLAPALLSGLFAIALFIALPQGLTSLLTKALHTDLSVQDPRFHVLTGMFKLVVLTAYLIVISRIPDVRRVFQYHGAEHKTIFAYESGLDLTVKNVQAQSTLHPRCGTTFLIVVVIVSIVVGSVVTPLVLPHASGFSGQLQTLVLRVSLLPFVAAISYELQRFSAKYCTTGPLRVLLWPGFLFQKITTREPTDEQVEVAISAMLAALWRERDGASAQVTDEPHVFASFDALRTAYASSLAPLAAASV